MYTGEGEGPAGNSHALVKHLGVSLSWLSYFLSHDLVLVASAMLLALEIAVMLGLGLGYKLSTKSQTLTTISLRIHITL